MAWTLPSLILHGEITILQNVAQIVYYAYHSNTHILESVLISNVLSNKPRIRDCFLHVVDVHLVEGWADVAGAIECVRPATRGTVQLLVASREGQGKRRFSEAGTQASWGRHLKPRRWKTWIKVF